MSKKRITPAMQKQCIEGLERLLALGYTQAQLARMLDADTATVNQWLRYGRVGSRMVGRISFVPELRNKITLRQVRPDMTSQEIMQTRANARKWFSATLSRPREVPGKRLNEAATALSRTFTKKYRGARSATLR